MDEERRTTRQPQGMHPRRADRVVFINTGFLDRTGDEIHTSMEAGPMIRKGDMKRDGPGSRPTRTRTSISAWSAAFPGRPRSARACGPCPTGWRRCWQKIAHPKAGANTAWVPSPTAATLHALHYHKVDVAPVQAELAWAAGAPRLDDILTPGSPAGRTGRRRRSSGSSTTTRRASSATSCAGSTRASAARRCPTSTTSA